MFRLLRIKADAVLLGFAAPTIRECAKDTDKNRFYKKWSEYVRQKKTPGLLTQTESSKHPGLFCKNLTALEWNCYNLSLGERAALIQLAKTKKHRSHQFCCVYYNNEGKPIIHLKRIS